MLHCNDRGCSCSVPITFRNRKNKMYHEKDYFCETPLQLCNSKCFKDTSDLWYVYIHQTSFEALPVAGCAICFPPSCSKGVLLLTPTRKFGLTVPAKVGMKGHLETSSSGGTVSMSGTSVRDRRRTVKPVERGGHCQRTVCVSGGLNCLWACFSVLGGWSICKSDASLSWLNRRDASELERENRYLANSWISCSCEFSADKFPLAANNTKMLWCSLFSKAPRKSLLYIGIIAQELWLLFFAWGYHVSNALEWYASAGDQDSTWWGKWPLLFDC